MKAQNPEDRLFIGQVSFNNDQSATTFCGNTLAEAVADAFKVASYHMVYHNDVSISKIIDICKFCEGKGEIPTGKLFRWKKCPKCKGKNSSIVVCESFTPVLSSNVKILPKGE
jgi:Zn finger protein HypA/HybF involved in hydrogenase expression